MPKADKRNLDPRTRSRTWLLTIANPMIDEVKDHPDILYCTWQIERGAPSESEPLGHRHMHVFVQFENARSLSAVSGFFKYIGTAHCDPCDMNAYFYATKSPGQEGDWKEKDFTVEVSPKEFGTLPRGIARQLKKSNEKKERKPTLSDEICLGLQDGTLTKQDIKEQYPGWYIVNERKIEYFINKHKASLIEKEIFKPWVIWLWGSTGTGKTRSAFDFERIYFDNKPDDVSISGKNECFVNGYLGNDAVVIDETRGEIPYKELLKMLDWNVGGKTINMKGIKDAKWFPKRIYITSCYRPENLYNGQMTKDDRIDQLLRRLSFCFHLQGEYDLHSEQILDDLYWDYTQFREQDPNHHLCLVGKNEKIVKNAHTTQVACKNPMQPVLSKNFDLDLTDEERVKRCTMTDDQKFMELRSKTVTDSQLHEEEMIEQRHKASLINLKQMFEDESEV